MQKLKSIVFAGGVLLLILSVTTAYLSIRNLSGIPSADSYEEKGVYTFAPVQVLPVQVRNTGASARDRRMNPTRTVYMVYYLATDGSGYRWSQKALTRERGEQAVEKGESITRKVLSIPDRHTYITVEPEQTAGTYTAELRKKYTLMLGLSVGYMLLYAAGCMGMYKKRKGMQEAAEQPQNRGAGMPG